MIDNSFLSQNLRKSANTSADKTKVVNIISQAFDNDPVFNWIVRQNQKQKRIRKLVESSVELTIPFEEIYISKDEKGTAVWVPPDKHKLSLYQTFKILNMFIQISGLKRIIEMMKFFSFMEKQYPKEPFFHLLYLAVVPEAQSKGIGASLMKPILNYCSQNNLYVYLENSSEKNLSLYEKNGFNVFKEWKISDDGPAIWFMKRKP